MLELGPGSALLHRKVGKDIARLKIDLLWGVRGDAKDLIEGACDGGMERKSTRYFASSEQAGAALVDEISRGDLVLIKGSRGVQTEMVINSLREHFPLVGADTR
jgi:UDP-N-acetylmuramoyl-tripeptide--D-alanyl-D-alanine ligase